MYNIILKNISNKYEYEELIKIFIRPDDYQLFTEDEIETDSEIQTDCETLIFNENNLSDKNLIKREIYEKLATLTGLRPEWGILTGVRPVKMASEMLAEFKNYALVNEKFREYYFLNEKKTDLILEILKYQKVSVENVTVNSVGIYIGIPFCPTRCLYCSFASNQASEARMEEYLFSLFKEIEFCGKEIKNSGFKIESFYIGGGTPTALNESQLLRLLDKILKTFDLDHAKEFTVEAGRPDTLNDEKLRILKNAGVQRISINPQSMKDKTLELIGRSHSAKDIERAYLQAREAGISIINCDVIAGLPEEDDEDFKRTLNKLIDMEFDNITVHTLSVKRASRLIDIDKEFHYKQAKIVKKQLEEGEKLLRAAGYIPYYLYRQKHMAGAFENIGWCKPKTESIYNIRIMEEAQTIIALGAGGISKAFYPKENRLERVPNVTNYEIYIERIDEMISRKEHNIFQEENKC
ncbi:MAG: coproporphyrinogen dehydrogenase HemZ [Eubacteriales bacterium]|nr:coproporphyrinogen dehydrogenase HemZ [Eubacteriales bacterium]MDD4389479.1 coproporphyrinogen dehydrogenase HemZ [Eubacteriales bacterium]